MEESVGQGQYIIADNTWTLSAFHRRLRNLEKLRSVSPAARRALARSPSASGPEHAVCFETTSTAIIGPAYRSARIVCLADELKRKR